jgi:hypothetical protein
MGILSTSGTSVRWGTDAFNQLITTVRCSDSAWSLWSKPFADSSLPSSWPDLYEVTINSTSIGGTIFGNCTTLVNVSAHIRIWHVPAGSGTYDHNVGSTGFFEGNVPLTITIIDNQCCKDAMGNCIHGDADSSGSCISPP